VRIGDYAVITLEEKSGKAARIAFDADRSVPITRVKKGVSAAQAMKGGIDAQITT
jgi:hypothetical protein